MSVLKKFTMEYGFKTTPRLLYTAIATPEGLSRWFADLVDIEDDVFHFKWEGSEQKARLVDYKENEFIRLLWLDDPDQEHFLQMEIVNDPLSSSVALVVTDHAEDVDLDFSQRVWDAQVKKLQRIFNA